MENYEDIINMEHHVSKKHIPMTMENRASQFAPFSALAGYEEAIKEMERVTHSKKIIDEDLKKQINETLLYIQKEQKQKIKLSVTYYVKDKEKNGGNYMTVVGYFKKLDIYNNIIYVNHNQILIDSIIGIYVDDACKFL